jgi:hypothetical protein
MDELKSRFEVSQDELTHRQQLQEKYHIEPSKQATAILEAAVDKVLQGLGVDTSDPTTIPQQMETLGIFANSIEDERMPKAMGIYISVVSGDTITPYCYIGNARLVSDGRCFVDIQYFLSNKLDETGGIKIL